MRAYRKVFSCKYERVLNGVPTGKVIEYRYDSSRWGSNNPSLEWAALLQAARKILGISLKEVAEAVGRNRHTIANAEQARYKLAVATEANVTRFYISEFVDRGWLSRAQAPPDSASLAVLRVALAKATIGRDASNMALEELRSTVDEVVAEALAERDGDPVDGVVSAAMRDERITPALKERLLGVAQ